MDGDCGRWYGDADRDPMEDGLEDPRTLCLCHGHQWPVEFPSRSKIFRRLVPDWHDRFTFLFFFLSAVSFNSSGVYNWGPRVVGTGLLGGRPYGVYLLVLDVRRIKRRKFSFSIMLYHLISWLVWIAAWGATFAAFVITVQRRATGLAHELALAKWIL